MNRIWNTFLTSVQIRADAPEVQGSHSEPDVFLVSCLAVKARPMRDCIGTARSKTTVAENMALRTRARMTSLSIERENVEPGH